MLIIAGLGLGSTIPRIVIIAATMPSRLKKNLKSKIDELCHAVPEYKQLEQMWPGCELCKGKALNGLSISKDSTFGLSLSRWAYGEKPEIPYCPNCSRPLTKEAWQDLRNKIGMLVKGALNTNETD